MITQLFEKNQVGFKKKFTNAYTNWKLKNSPNMNCTKSEVDVSPACYPINSLQISSSNTSVEISSSNTHSPLSNASCSNSEELEPVMIIRMLLFFFEV